MTDAPSPARARAELAFRSPVAAVAPEVKLSAWDEYKARQQAALDKMARLRAARLAKEAATLDLGAQRSSKRREK